MLIVCLIGVVGCIIFGLCVFFASIGELIKTGDLLYLWYAVIMLFFTAIFLIFLIETTKPYLIK